MYSIEIKKSAFKELSQIAKTHQQRIIEAIDLLAFQPRPEGVKKLKKDLGFRIRIGEYRVIYTIQDVIKIVEIIRIGHRKDVYRS